GRGTQFEAIVTEHDENALRGGRKWRKSELRGVGHRCPLWIGQAEIIGLAGPPPLWRGRTVLQSPERPVPSPMIRPPNEAGTLSFYCAPSTTLPWRGHFVDGSKRGLQGDGHWRRHALPRGRRAGVRPRVGDSARGVDHPLHFPHHL